MCVRTVWNDPHEIVLIIIRGKESEVPKVPENAVKPPKDIPQPKMSKSERMALAGLFDHKVVATRYSPRYAHVLVGNKTLCGISADGVRILDGVWNDYAKCLRCQHTMDKAVNITEDS